MFKSAGPSHRARALLLGVALMAPVVLLAGPSAAGETVSVVLNNTDADHMTMTIDKTSVKAGEVTFDVVNQSTDTVHEMLVIRSEGAGKELPYDAKAEKIIEEEAQDLGEVADLDPGKGGTLTVTLEPGEYVLLCNEPGHYKHGMAANFTVTQ